MKEWMVAVDDVSLCPKGKIELPEHGWVALRFDQNHRECNLSAGRVVRLPGLFEASIRKDVLSLLAPAGTVLEFYKLDEHLNDPTKSGIMIDLPAKVIFNIRAEIAAILQSTGSIELPPKTAVVWPKSGSMDDPQ